MAQLLHASKLPHSHDAGSKDQSLEATARHHLIGVKYIYVVFVHEVSSSGFLVENGIGAESYISITHQQKARPTHDQILKLDHMLISLQSKPSSHRRIAAWLPQ